MPHAVPHPDGPFNDGTYGKHQRNAQPDEPKHIVENGLPGHDPFGRDGVSGAQSGYVISRQPRPQAFGGEGQVGWLGSGAPLRDENNAAGAEANQQEATGYDPTTPTKRIPGFYGMTYQSPQDFVGGVTADAGAAIGAALAEQKNPSGEAADGPAVDDSIYFGVFTHECLPEHPNHLLEVSTKDTGDWFATEENEDGTLTITGFDLTAVNWDEGCTFTIPAYIDGVKVTRLDDLYRVSRLKSWNVKHTLSPATGIIDSIVLPDTLEHVGRNVFSLILPRNIFIPPHLTQIDSVGLSGAMPRQHTAIASLRAALMAGGPEDEASAAAADARRSGRAKAISSGHGRKGFGGESVAYTPDDKDQRSIDDDYPFPRFAGGMATASVGKPGDKTRQQDGPWPHFQERRAAGSVSKPPEKPREVFNASGIVASVEKYQAPTAAPDSDDSGSSALYKADPGSVATIGRFQTPIEGAFEATSMAPRAGFRYESPYPSTAAALPPYEHVNWHMADSEDAPIYAGIGGPDDRSLPGMRFHVHPDNQTFCSINGSLFSKDLKQLLFLSMPYPRVLALPPETESIEREACVYGFGLPKAVIVPPKLNRVEFTPNLECLWICPDRTGFYQYAHAHGWMVTTTTLGHTDQFDYDIDDDGNAHIVRCHGRRLSVEIPDQIDGHPVTHIGNNAFPTNVKSIIMADSVKYVAGANACFSLENLTLSRGLVKIGPNAFHTSKLKDPLVIPSSCTDIASTSFDGGLVIFEAAENAPISLDMSFARTCFRHGAPPFNFAAYDYSLAAYNEVNRKLKSVFVRLGSTFGMSDEIKHSYQEFLLGQYKKSLAHLERTGSLGVLEALIEAGAFTPDRIDEAVQRLLAAGQKECSIALLNYKHEAYGHVDGSSSGRFSL